MIILFTANLKKAVLFSILCKYALNDACHSAKSTRHTLRILDFSLFSELFRTNEKTSKIYFTSPRRPPFRITRKSVPRFIRGERSINPLNSASHFPRRFLLERDSPVDKTIAGGIIGIIYAGFAVGYTNGSAMRLGMLQGRGDTLYV